MNIKQIYKEQQAFFEIKISEMYNSFVKRIEKDRDYTLADDEVSGLFNELLLNYIYKTISLYEWNRIIEKQIINKMKSKLFYQCLEWLNKGLITPEEMVRLLKEDREKNYEEKM